MTRANIDSFCLANSQEISIELETAVQEKEEMKSRVHKYITEVSRWESLMAAKVNNSVWLAFKTGFLRALFAFNSASSIMYWTFEIRYYILDI